MADVAPLLDRLPILADRLAEALQGELRALFDALQLDVVFQPADGVVDVAITLYDRGSETATSAAQVRAADWSVRACGEAFTFGPQLDLGCLFSGSPTG